MIRKENKRLDLRLALLAQISHAVLFLTENLITKRAARAARGIGTICEYHA